MSADRTLLLVDLSGIYWTHYHVSADKPLSEAFNATVGKVHALRQGYDFVALCIDSPPYFRKDLLPAYKANREAAPPQAVEQFARVRERLVRDGLLLWGAPTFEADDVIATAVERGVEEGLGVVVASADKDLLQLVDDDRDVRVFSPFSDKLYRREEVIVKFGVSPEMIPDFLALVGDKSDNVQGVPGVGQVKAAKLLHKWGTLADVLFNADKNTPALRDALITHGQAALLARKLVELRRDVPIDFAELYKERRHQPLREVTAMPGNDDGFDFDDNDDEGAPERETRDSCPIEISGPPKPVAPPAPKSDPKAAEQPKSEPRPAEAAPKTESKPAPTPAPEPPGPGVAKAGPEPSTALIVHPGDWALTLEPRNLKQAWWLAKVLFESRLYQAFGSAEAIYAVMLRGRAIGLDATTALASFHVIEGKPAMHADLIHGLVLKSEKAEYFDCKITSRTRAVFVTKRIGARHEVEVEWTLDDAVSAGLMRKDPRTGTYHGVGREGKATNWDKNPRAMLRARAKSELARLVYPDVVLGLYTPDELSGGTDNSNIPDAEFEAA